MSFLFDTDAISEVLRKKPSPAYLRWLRTIPRDEQYTSAVCIGELYKGAFRAEQRDHHLRNIEKRVLPMLTVLPYDVAVARVFGETRADLEERGVILPDADIQIAATAIHHELQLVTGNLKHFQRIPGLVLTTRLAASR